MPIVDPSKIRPVPRTIPASPLPTQAQAFPNALMPPLVNPQREFSNRQETARLGLSQETANRTAANDAIRLKMEARRLELAEQAEQRQRDKDKGKDDPAKFREPVDELLNVVDAAANAHRMTRKGGLASDPWGRSGGQYLPGTSARAVRGYNDTITANTAFKTLQQMRAESPTGGAVGNVSDTDMKLLGSTIASLDPGLPTKQYQKNLQNVLDAYRKVLYKLPGGFNAYRAWRTEFLGYDPILKKKKGAAASKDVEDILSKYGVK